MSQPQSVPDFLQAMPRKALVMGGNWNKQTPPEDLVLSLESQLRVRAAGVLATNRLLDTVIFTAGLTRGPEDTPEATVQNRMFRQEFPELEGKVTTLEEDLGHTTKADAIYTQALTEAVDLHGPFALISTDSFLKRQTKVFEAEGFSIFPVSAEEVLASLAGQGDAMRAYHRSARHRAIQAQNVILRGFQLVGLHDAVTERLAAKARPNHA